VFNYRGVTFSYLNPKIAVLKLNFIVSNDALLEFPSSILVNSGPMHCDATVVNFCADYFIIRDLDSSA
ncbi:MAG: hypothetical protein KAS38_05145, partial [Anaerolineales bacterium]|nr:hypothetical protein [Anaerolineales bacterium]